MVKPCLSFLHVHLPFRPTINRSSGAVFLVSIGGLDPELAALAMLTPIPRIPSPSRLFVCRRL